MTRRRTHTRKGFNLIESAIVLGVVGLVIGGIWVAAAGVRENMRINETATNIIQITDGARRLFPYRNYPTVGNGLNVTSTSAAAKVLPSCCCY